MQEGHLGPWVLMAKGRGGNLRAGGVSLPFSSCPGPGQQLPLSCVPAFWAPFVPGHTQLCWGLGVWPGGSVFQPRSAHSPPGRCAHTYAHTQVQLSHSLAQEASSLRATAL